MSDKKIGGMIDIVAEARELCQIWIVELYVNRDIDCDEFRGSLSKLGYSESFIDQYE